MSDAEMEAVSVPSVVHKTTEGEGGNTQDPPQQTPSGGLTNGFDLNNCNETDTEQSENCDKDDSESESGNVQTHEQKDNVAVETVQVHDTAVPSTGESSKESVKQETSNSTKENVPELTGQEQHQEQTNDVEQNSESKTSEEVSRDEEKEIDIFGNGLLVKKLLRKAEKSSERPSDGYACTINIDIKLADGTLVERMENFNFFLGEHDVMVALDVGIKFMYIGEISEFVTDARYAFAERGRAPDIPPNSSLLLTVELLHVYPPVDHSKLSVDHRLALGEKKRVRGNELYTQKEFSTAIEVYSRAIHVLDPKVGSFTEAPTKLQEFLDCRVKCFNNMCICQMKLGYNEAAIKSANEVLNVQPDNWKALGRLGKALGLAGNLKKAIETLKKCEKLNTKDEKFQSENRALLESYMKKAAKETEKEKKMYQKMFGLDNTAQPKAEPKATESIFASSWKWALGGVGVALVAVGVTAAFKYFQH